MKVVLFGTPSFAVPVLDALRKSRHDVVAAVSQPDRAKDRKGRLLPTPLKEAAAKAGLPIFQFQSAKKEGIDTLKSLGADIIVTAAYGQILSQEILDIPKYGVINVHASLLPMYRGSSPIQHAILNGDRETGITIMQTRLGLDSGEIILQRALNIGENENYAELSERLSHLGAELAVEALGLIENGQATLTPQNDVYVTHCGKITAELGRLNFSRTAKDIHNTVRALDCHAYHDGKLIKIVQTVLVDDFLQDLQGVEIGEVIDARRMIVCCGEGFVDVLKLVPQGGKPMSGKDYLLGRKNMKIVLN